MLMFLKSEHRLRALRIKAAECEALASKYETGGVRERRWAETLRAEAALCRKAIAKAEGRND
jgi:hypothetical protein